MELSIFIMLTLSHGLFCNSGRLDMSNKDQVSAHPPHLKPSLSLCDFCDIGKCDFSRDQEFHIFLHLSNSPNHRTIFHHNGSKDTCPKQAPSYSRAFHKTQHVVTSAQLSTAVDNVPHTVYCHENQTIGELLWHNTTRQYRLRLV